MPEVVEPARQAECVAKVDEFLRNRVWHAVNDEFPFARELKQSLNDERSHLKFAFALRGFGVVP